MKTFVVAVAVALCAGITLADTFTWSLAGGYAWDTNICWAGDNPSNQYGFPNVATDVAIINSIRTNSAGNRQIWPNQFDNYLGETTVGQWFLNMSNDLTFGAGDDSEPNGFFFVNNGADSRLCFSNIYMDNGWWNHSLDLRFATYYVLSNDLRVTLASVPDGVGDRDYAILWIVDDASVFGDHSIIVDGAGRMIVGVQYSDTFQYSNPKILTTKPTIVNDAVLDVNHNAVFAAPVHLTDVGPYDIGYFRQYGEESTDVDISFLGGYYFANWTGVAGITNLGDMVCHDQGNFYIGYWPGDGDTDYRKAIFPGTLSGTNYVINWHNGDSSFTGVVSPGTGTSEYNIGWLYFVRWTNGFQYVGRPEAPAQLDIEINGMGDEPEVDNDIVYFDGQPYLTLSNMNLHVYAGQYDPNKTNLILYSFDSGADIGEFKSVTWHPATVEGTVIYYNNAVEITDLHIVPEPAAIAACAALAMLVARRKR